MSKLFFVFGLLICLNSFSQVKTIDDLIVKFNEEIVNKDTAKKSHKSVELSYNDKGKFFVRYYGADGEMIKEYSAYFYHLDENNIIDVSKTKDTCQLEIRGMNLKPWVQYRTDSESKTPVYTLQQIFCNTHCNSSESLKTLFKEIIIEGKKKFPPPVQAPVKPK